MNKLDQINNFQNSSNETAQNFEGANIVNQTNHFYNAPKNIIALVHKLFSFLFIHIGLTSILFFTDHSINNTYLSLYNYFDLFFKLILFGYIPLMFIVGVILFIILIVVKIFKFIFNVKKDKL